jgi:hypothetical protein
MAEHLRDDLRVDALDEEQAGRGMAQVAKAGARQLGGRPDRCPIGAEELAA